MELIDDPAKAEDMAYASKRLRSQADLSREKASELREKAEKEENGAKALIAETDDAENLAGTRYEEIKRIQALTDEELSSARQDIRKEYYSGNRGGRVFSETFREMEREAVKRGLITRHQMVFPDDF